MLFERQLGGGEFVFGMWYWWCAVKFFCVGCVGERFGGGVGVDLELVW